MENTIIVDDGSGMHECNYSLCTNSCIVSFNHDIKHQVTFMEKYSTCVLCKNRALFEMWKESIKTQGIIMIWDIMIDANTYVYIKNQKQWKGVFPHLWRHNGLALGHYNAYDESLVCLVTWNTRYCTYIWRIRPHNSYTFVPKLTSHCNMICVWKQVGYYAASCKC